MSASPDHNGPTSLTVWRVCDGKRGHENQSLGLIDALQRRLDVEAHDVLVTDTAGANASLGTLPRPRLLIGAGHATHKFLWRAKQATGALAVVLMRPSFSLHRFDLCVVPEHDGLPNSESVLTTRGVLNRIRQNPQPDSDRGLILIGGPSRHYDWLDVELVTQIEQLVRLSRADMRWTISNSRRTPLRTWTRLQDLKLPRTTLVDWTEQSPDWLPEAFTAGTVWVSEDSVSMVYEALSSGAAVGLLAVPRRSHNRVMRGVARLIADGVVIPFTLWRGGTSLRPPEPVLAEADRCAEWISARWLSNR